MSTRTFTAGHLIEEWDDAEMIHRKLVDDVWVTRPYTAEEVAAVTPTVAVDPLDELTVDVLVSL